jgi:AmmeMemoRadiSam system protein A
MFTLEQGAKLVKLAKHAIETILFNTPLNLGPFNDLTQKMGVYVTLRKNGKLRGQMGTVESKDELHHAVLKAARDAAFNDRRFEHVSREELHEIEIEVAVLVNSRLLRVSRPEDFFREIHVGADGLMIKSGLYSAVLLPDRAMTHGWDVERLLRYLCSSAGMTMDAWKDLNDNIYVFQCQIFSDKNGRIIEVI